jgi:hypothetical protein
MFMKLGWGSDAVIRFHETLIYLLILAAMVAPVLWVGFLFMRDIRLPWKTHLLQVLVFALGWLPEALAIVFMESQNLPGWFLD